MTRIAAATVIRGEGACKAYYDGIINEEVERLQREHAREAAALRAQIEATEAHRDKLLADRLKDWRPPAPRRKSFGERVADKIEFCWACAIAWGLELGLWAYEEDE